MESTLKQAAYAFRPVTAEDNPAVANLIRTVLTEFGCVGEGFAYADPETDAMFETYQAPGSRYYVLTGHSGQVVGGGGFSRLKGTTPEEAVCELQKLYFFSETRGRGLGRQLLEILITEARQAGYRRMYLETVPQMAGAIGLYKKAGFQPLDRHMGNTGHQVNCQIYMARVLGG